MTRTRPIRPSSSGRRDWNLAAASFGFRVGWWLVDAAQRCRELVARIGGMR